MIGSLFSSNRLPSPGGLVRACKERSISFIRMLKVPSRYLPTYLLTYLPSTYLPYPLTYREPPKYLPTYLVPPAYLLIIR